MIATRLAPNTSLVPIEPASAFYPVRDEHQDYYKKQGIKYQYYRFTKTSCSDAIYFSSHPPYLLRPYLENTDRVSMKD